MRRHLRDLSRFVAQAENSGAVVAILPIEIGTAFDAATLTRYERFVAEGRAAGLPFVSISHAFDGHSAQSITVSSLDGHPNALGHDLAAAAAAPALLERWQLHVAAHDARVGDTAARPVAMRGSSDALAPSVERSHERHQ